MRRILVLAAALAWVVVATEARGDMVYLKDGQGIWGKDVYEEGDSVVVERPGGSLRFPKGQVDRIERTRSSLPPFYVPPEGAPATPPAPAAGPAGAPGAPGAAGQPGAPPASPGGAAAPGSATGSSRATTPPSTGPTALPPAPAPPPPGGSSQ